MFVSHKNSAVFANFLAQNAAPSDEQFFLATEASFSADSSLEANKIFGESRISNDYNISGPQLGKFSATFLPLIGPNSSTSINNQMALITGLTGDFTSGHIIKFGNFNLRKCYLSSLNLDISPQATVQVRADFDVYDMSDITGQYFTGLNIATTLTNNGSGAYLQSIHALAMGVSGSGVNLPDSKQNISVDYGINRTPIYNLGDTYPSTVILDAVEKKVSIDGENIGSSIGFSGENAILNLSFYPFASFIADGTGILGQNPVFRICTTGRVVSQSLDVSPEGVAGSVSILENVF